MTSANHPPLNGAGADSVDPAWNRKPYRVLIEEELGSRLSIVVRAIGKHDARNLACEEARSRGYFDVTALTIEELTEASLDHQDREHDRAVAS